MKKLFALLLAVVVMMSLAACGEDKTPTEPNNGDKPGVSTPATNPDESTPDVSNPDKTTPSKPDGAWVIKEDVSTPEFMTPQAVRENIKKLDGSTLEVTLYQAMWSQVKPEDIKAKVAPLLEGWIWSIEKAETVYAEEYKDVGEQRDYDYTVRLVATKPVDEYVNNTVTITFTGDTSTFIGWRGISVNYSTPGDEMNAEAQAFVLPILEQVFDKNIAEYMVYAPVTEPRYNEMECSKENVIGSEKYGRRLDDNSAYFSMYAYGNDKVGIDKFAGKYQSILNNGTPEYCDTVFPSLGKIDFGTIATVGADFLSKNLNDYDFTEPSSIDKLYTYEVTEYENGDKDVYFHADLNARQKDTTWIETMTFEFEYTIEVRDGVVNVKRASITVPAFAEDWDNNDPEDPTVIKRMAENLEKAKKVANAVFGTNFEFSEVYWNGSGDYKLWDNCKTELWGREVSIRFDFTTKTLDSISRNRATVSLSIY
ncbi:MAG: hypothetical protein IJZ68_06345 [Bacteroidaceae bacterium]|nr:hypothetical protein [Bacteroidaceae bacterium]